jgi:antitoxin HicB
MTPRDYLKEPYARMVIPDETGGYYAEILEFPGCFAEGDSVEETYRELQNAAESWIEVRLSQGLEVPPPSSSLDFSGTVSLRIPRSIHKRAALMAERDRTSLNTYLVSAVANRIGADDLYSAMVQRLEQHLTTTLSNFARDYYRLLWQSFNSVEQTSALQPTIRKLQITENATTTSPTISSARK